jgi:CubicO group peptidase (beta-lactamase class C family)
MFISTTYLRSQYTPEGASFDMAKLATATIKYLQQLTDESCADSEKGISGVTAVVVNKDGEELFAHAAGTQGVGTTEPMTLENVYWIASCTKMICAVACMQLVEQGKLALDDSDLVEKFCPELKAVKVLQDDGTLVEKKRGITLRMLLSHTCLYLTVQ